MTLDAISGTLKKKMPFQRDPSVRLLSCFFIEIILFCASTG